MPLRESWHTTTALRGLVQQVRAINPRMICPQHGSIFKGEHVGKLLDWLESLEVGQWKGTAPKTETRAAA